MKNLLALLSIVIKHYSKQPIKHLFDNHLFIQVYFFAEHQIASNFITGIIPNLHKSKKKVLINFQTNLVYVKISHQKQELSKHLLKSLLTELQNCLLVCQKPQIQLNSSTKNTNVEQTHHYFDNIFSKYRQNETDNFLETCKKNQANINGVFINLTKNKNYINKNQTLQNIKEEIHAHLSICQLFHAHTNLILSLNQIRNNSQIQSKFLIPKLKQKNFLNENDEDNFLEESYYCRIFQPRASKVTLEDLSELCKIQTFLWGELLTISQGIDGLIIWTLKNSFPMLEDIQINSFNHHFQKDKSLKLCETSNGKLIFKVKSKTHLKNDELNFHVIILNFKQDYAKNRRQIFEYQIQKQIKKFKNLKTKTKQELQLQQDIGDIQKLCENLTIDSYPIVRWLFFQQVNKKNE